MECRLHHVHLICKDLENMISFFTQCLNASIVTRQKFGAAEGVTLDLNGTFINMRVANEGEDLIDDSVRNRYGYDHIGLEVEDLSAAYAELDQKGYRFHVTPPETDNQIAFFKGPEGITIELLQQQHC